MKPYYITGEEPITATYEDLFQEWEEWEESSVEEDEEDEEDSTWNLDFILVTRLLY